MLNRLANAIEILPASDVKRCQPQPQQTTEEDSNISFENGDIAQVEREFGLVFHVPLKALSYIQKTKYFHGVHVSYN